jgi:hypothetical protein
VGSKRFRKSTIQTIVATAANSDFPLPFRYKIPKQLHITPLQSPTFAKPFPAYFSGPYIDIKEAMKNYLTETWYRKNCPEDPPTKGTPVRFSTRPGPHRWSRSPKYYRNLAGQLEALNMGKFQGRQHSGIDVSSKPIERRRRSNIS